MKVSSPEDVRYVITNNNCCDKRDKLFMVSELPPGLILFAHCDEQMDQEVDTIPLKQLCLKRKGRYL